MLRSVSACVCVMDAGTALCRLYAVIRSLWASHSSQGKELEHNRSFAGTPAMQSRADPSSHRALPRWASLKYLKRLCYKFKLFRIL